MGGKVAKRSLNACTRCRRQKIKCSGTQPCDGCTKRKLTCVFDDSEQKILVTKGYLAELEQKLASIQQNEKSDPCPLSPDDLDDRSPGIFSQPKIHRDVPDNASEPELDDAASSLKNPLSSGPPAFMSAANGRMFYLGTSSNWSFTRRVLSLTHEHIHQEPLPAGTLLFEGLTYDLGWDGMRTTPSLEIPVVPSLDHTIYLINAVKFRCGQIYHLFDESEFMTSLHEFYSNPGPAATGSLWYIHFLLILAFGKAFVQQKFPDNRPPGSEYFVKALQLLPDASVFHREPIVSTEILCCIALYLQSLDHRSSAHNYIGQAMRLAMAQGMHTQMPVEYLGEIRVERCREIWWTVYILDREMTSLMGLPQSINDDHVYTQLPTFSGSARKISALGMQIKLSRIIAEINSTVYAIDGRLNRTFLLSTKTALANIAGLADELHLSFPLHLDRAISGISRNPAYLHLLYHQCIVLATRPLMFCFLKIQFESPDSYVGYLNTSRNVQSLIQMCMDSSQQIVSILHSLHSEGLLETFLPFDLDSIFMSTTVLLIGLAIDTKMLDNHPGWVDKAYTIFDEIVQSGHLIAKFRRAELQQLEEMLSIVPRDQARCLSVPVSFPQNQSSLSQHVPLASSFPSSATHALQADDIMPESNAVIADDCTFTAGLTAAQIMAVANSIESIDTEWMSNTMIEHSIW
ncbi:hypothetical protein NUU61_007445 [Penicillium alfredii]|uniref:Zn(2)-C6 fungal-type domain-containing protein n=1 Tax=Penicillium alfredii TaxID=1506179 RepID=A0A9W9F318_9EURO|nr:uncharacterized protein NUU61_007445 [Penicillium alfredii]KAJ5092575.1 hypothetical protein NUU61_007445 [Penicillium alfredii]